MPLFGASAHQTGWGHSNFRRAEPAELPIVSPSRLRIYSDPLQHAAIAALVAAPLVPRAGSRVIATAVGAAFFIDIDHAIAARSLRIRATTSLATRPRSHSLLTALGLGASVTAGGGPGGGGGGGGGGG